MSSPIASMTLCLVLTTTAAGLAQDRIETGSSRGAERTTLIDDTSVDATNPLPQDDKKAKPAPTESRRELYAKLEKRLTGTKWIGNFTQTGKDLDELTTEEYQILSAKKLDEGEYWSLIVRIKYGKNDMTLPLPPVEILWAGRTPVITIDRLMIPLLGTFDARVIIRGDKYAGTWNHDKVGGHLFGTIEKLPASDDKKKND